MEIVNWQELSIVIDERSMVPIRHIAQRYDVISKKKKKESLMRPYGKVHKQIVYEIVMVSQII